MAVFCVQMCQVYVIQLVYLIYTYALGSRNTFSGSHTVTVHALPLFLWVVTYVKLNWSHDWAKVMWYRCIQKFEWYSMYLTHREVVLTCTRLHAHFST